MYVPSQHTLWHVYKVYHHSVCHFKYLLHMWYISSQNEYVSPAPARTKHHESFSDETCNTKVQTLTQVLYLNNLYDVYQFLLSIHFGCLYFVIASICEEGYRFDRDELICTGKQDMHGECT